MLGAVLPILPLSVRTTRVRADAGFYNYDFIAKLSEKNIKFATMAKMTKP